MKKNCAICDAEFEPNRYNHTTAKYCSDECKLEKRRGHNCQHLFNCAICDAEFEVEGAYSCQIKYCSDECRRENGRRKYHESNAYTPVQPRTKMCVICDAQFETTRRALVCGDECRAVRKKQQSAIYRARPEIIEKRIQRNKNKREHDRAMTRVRMARPGMMEKKRLLQRRYRADPNNTRNTPMGRLHHRIGVQVRGCLKRRGIKKTNKTFALLGYTKAELMTHLESQFTDGMSWENRSEWHIDHIRPVSSFDFDSTDHPDFKECWALDNLQPLWAADNMSKATKWDGVVNV